MVLRRTARIGILFSLPAIIFFILFLFIPVVSTFLLSITEWKGFDIANIRFAGLSNFRELIEDKIFFISLKNTLIFVAFTTVVLNILGYIGATIIDSGRRGTGFFKNALFLPVLLAPIIIGIMWSRMLDAFGIVNQLLKAMEITKMPILFLGDQRIAL